ncbi:MAG: DUF2809 domain-containing protein, partial [Oscillospiraceae bacterium]|nr:DUF2809 domain-containing protein [Oscillospiraceae bacterium]
AVLLLIEILIGMYAHGWVRSYLGDVLVVILIYALARAISPDIPRRWYILPTGILLFAYCVEGLQLWGFCDKLGIQDRLLRIIIGTGFSVTDLFCYTAGIVPCYIADYVMSHRRREG